MLVNNVKVITLSSDSGRKKLMEKISPLVNSNILLTCFLSVFFFFIDFLQIKSTTFSHTF